MRTVEEALKSIQEGAAFLLGEIRAGRLCWSPSQQATEHWGLVAFEARDIPPFSYKWMDGEVKDYPRAEEAGVELGGKKEVFVIGWTTHPSAGMVNRARASTFLKRKGTLEPLVDFSGGENFQNDGLMAAVIKIRDGGRTRALRLDEPLPQSYADLPTCPFNEIVTGKGAWARWAVKAHKDDSPLIVRTAIERAHMRGLV
jgi:hypothetical protein